MLGDIVEQDSTGRMTVDEFFAWNDDNPGRFELVDGRLYPMSPVRLRHAETKGLVFVALRAAIERSLRPCKVFPDGVTAA